MLEIKNITIGYKTVRGVVKAVNQVSFTLGGGRIMGLVGESGCGKSTVLYSVMGLVREPGKLIEGEILFDGRDITRNTAREWRRIRGKEISMIFQDPMTTLNPAYRVGKQILEMLKAHEKPGGLPELWRPGNRRRRKERVLQLMKEVGIPDPEKRYYEYPHQFSGGMQQRALIAMALACGPRLLLADEPTTALDVTIQAQILDLLKKINKSHGTAILLVTHDLGVASEFCDEIAVMYAGQIVEQGRTEEILQNPRHPYTVGLISSIPRISGKKGKIKPIEGNVIDLLDIKEECAFFERCDQAGESCKKQVPITGPCGRQVRCVLYE